MHSMKRVRLAVLFLVAAALLACTPAFAANQGTANLTCVADPMDPDYGASGVAKLTGVKPVQFDWGYEYVGKLSVSCSGLTPGATYTVIGLGFTAAFTAARNGNGSVGVKVFGAGQQVSVVRDDGTLVLVGFVSAL